MSERTFFSLRYTLPGYTLILIAILLFIPELQTNIFSEGQGALFTAFLAFLFLFSGHALGFLVSQVWYFIFNSCIMGTYPWMNEKAELVKDAYKLNPDKYHRVIFFDYILRLNTNKKLKESVERRYDLLHLYGSTLTSTFLGLALSFCVIIYRLYQQSILLQSIQFGELVNEIKIFTLVFTVFIFLFLNWRHVKKLHYMPFEVAVTEVVKQGAFPVWKAKRVFPAHYFLKENTNDEQ